MGLSGSGMAYHGVHGHEISACASGRSFCGDCASPRLGRVRILALALPIWVLITTSSCSSSSSPSSPSPLPQPNSTINYMAIAASDGDGIGSSAECIPFTDCPNGKGYVQVAVRNLRAQGYTVNLTNVSIPTATIGRDFQDLGNQYGHLVLGNFIQNEAPFTPTNSTLITIFAGANDVNVVTRALGGGAGAGDQLGFLNASCGRSAATTRRCSACCDRARPLRASSR
jgi:hypothetical protein